MQSGKSSLPGFSIVSALAMLLLQGCHQAMPLPLTPVADNTFLDLLAGWRLRVVAPVLNDPAQPYSMKLNADGPLAFTVAATPNLKGFETQYYEVTGTGSRVSIAFDRATLTRNGLPEDEEKPLKNYFPVPSGRCHMRLVYLTRSNNAPHDMALVFARRPSELNLIADHVTEDPGACTSKPMNCLWIPAGLAVIAERRESASADAWRPVQ